jgi:hypothetical protein
MVLLHHRKTKHNLFYKHVFKCLNDVLKAMTEPTITDATAENTGDTFPPLITLSGYKNTMPGEHSLLVPVTQKLMDAPASNTPHNINIFKLVNPYNVSPNLGFTYW